MSFPRAPRRAKGVVLTCALALGLLVAIGPVDQAEAAKFDVDMTWTPDDQDLVPGKSTVLDTFDSSGDPFGEAFVETRTPRSQVGQDIRNGKWNISFGTQKNRGQCFGTFRIERNVLETTPTSQTVQYGGILKIAGCKKSNRFNGVRPGKLGELQGETMCTATGCRGGLEITGKLTT